MLIYFSNWDTFFPLLSIHSVLFFSSSSIKEIIKYENDFSFNAKYFIYFPKFVVISSMKTRSVNQEEEGADSLPIERFEICSFFHKKLYKLISDRIRWGKRDMPIKSLENLVKEKTRGWNAWIRLNECCSSLYLTRTSDWIPISSVDTAFTIQIKKTFTSTFHIRLTGVFSDAILFTFIGICRTSARSCLCFIYWQNPKLSSINNWKYHLQIWARTSIQSKTPTKKVRPISSLIEDFNRMKKTESFEMIVKNCRCYIYCIQDRLDALLHQVQKIPKRFAYELRWKRKSACVISEIECIYSAMKSTCRS